MCSEWVADTFPGYFVTYLGRASLPVAEVILTQEKRPLSGEDTGIYGDFLRILGLSSPFQGWEAVDWPGMYVVFPGDSEGERHRIAITARLPDVAVNGERHAGKSELDAVLGRLLYWHRTIATWVLKVVVDSFQESAGQLRDAYGTLGPASSKSEVRLHQLNTQLLNLERDGVPFADEIQEYVRDDRRFLHDVQEFRSTDEHYRALDPKLELIRAIGKQLAASSESFLRRMDQLRRIADRSATVASAEATNRLARTNTRLARTNIWLQVAVLGLTLVMLGLALYEP
jgi:hypothetical protein